MRHLNIITTLIFLLGFLGASGASANIILLTQPQRNQMVSIHTKEDTSNRISCVPQQSSTNLWKCEDSYGNQFDNLIILKESKNGNTKRARN